ncbi:MAG TPA: hypothetical protein VMT55_04155 [Candidatus Sulfotelmatobacter sp.]|nr:hypothetical protein [Candidatus Sulfotelmatobacter sp.]
MASKIPVKSARLILLLNGARIKIVKKGNFFRPGIVKESMKNKLLAGVSIVLVGILTVSCAETNNQNLFNRLKDRLQLTDQQAVQVKPIFDEQIVKARAIIKEARDKKTAGTFDYSRVLTASSETVSGSKEMIVGSGEAGSDQLVVKLQALGQETEQKLTPILSAQQIAEYHKMVSEMIEKLKTVQAEQGRGGRGRGGRHRGGFSGGLGAPGGGFMR